MRRLLSFLGNDVMSFRIQNHAIVFVVLIVSLCSHVFVTDDSFGQPPGFPGSGFPGSGSGSTNPAFMSAGAGSTCPAPAPSATVDVESLIVNPFRRTCINYAYIGMEPPVCEIDPEVSSCNSCGSGNNQVRAVQEDSLPRFRPSLRTQLVDSDCFFSGGQSFVDNQRFDFLHTSHDHLPSNPNSVRFERIHRTRDLTAPGSLGPGIRCNFDFRLTFTTGDSLLLDNPQLLTPQLCKLDASGSYVQTTTYNSPFSGAADDDSPRFKHVQILNAQNNPISPLPANSGIAIPFTGAKFALLQLLDGGYMKFELVASVSPNTLDSGRLIESKSRHGSGLTVTYRTWTAQELINSPSRVWQMSTASDSTGAAITFEYHPNQQSGNWSLSKITVPGGQDVLYSYAGGYLKDVTYADGSKTTVGFFANFSGWKHWELTPVVHRRTGFVSGSFQSF